MFKEGNDSCDLEKSLNNDGTCHWQESASNVSGLAAQCCEQSGVDLVFLFPVCDACRTNSVAHESCQPLMSQTRDSLRTIDNVHRFQWQPNCPTDLQKWQTLRQTENTHGRDTRAPSDKSQKGLTTLWCDEQQSHSTTDQISSSPRIPVSISELSEPHLFSNFNLRPVIWHRGPRP